MKYMYNPMGIVDRRGEIGDRANKGQAAGCMEQVLQKGLWQEKKPGVG